MENKNKDELTKKEKLKVAYVAIYTLVLLVVIGYSLINPSIMSDVISLIKTISAAFGIIL